MEAKLFGQVTDAFSGPAGWSYQIVPGGNGEILQVVVPEPASFGLIALTGFLALRRRRGDGGAGVGDLAATGVGVVGDSSTSQVSGCETS